MFQHASSSKTYPFSVSKLHLRALFESPILFSVLDVLLDELFRQITPPPSRLVRLGDRSSGCGWGALELEAVAPLRGFSLGRLRLRCQHLVEGVEVQRPEIIRRLEMKMVRESNLDLSHLALFSSILSSIAASKSMVSSLSCSPAATMSELVLILGSMSPE